MINSNKLLLTFIFLMFSMQVFAELKIISIKRVWMEIEDPIEIYFNHDFEGLVDRWNTIKERIYSENTTKEVLSIDLDDDGDLDHLYTSWMPNGRLGITIDWYTINNGGKHYGWVERQLFDDGSKVIGMSRGDSFELHNDWKTIQMPINNKMVHGLLSQGGYSHGYLSDELLYFKKNNVGEYSHEWRLLMLSQSHPEPNSEPDIRTYDDGFTTMLTNIPLGTEKYKKFYHEKIGQYILTPKGKRSYEVVSSFNFYEAIKKKLKEKTVEKTN